MKADLSYSEFLGTVHNTSIDDVDELLTNGSTIGARINNFLQHTMPACYILDYTRKKYIYASPRMKDLIEHPISHFLDGGVEFAFKLWHKQDLKVFDEKIFPANLDFLKATPPAEYSSYLFQCNYRGKRKSGEYRHVMQESFFIKATSTGLPLASIGFLYDVSSFVTGNKLNHRIVRLDKDEKSGAHPSVVQNNTFISGSEEITLTKREIEILKCVCDDLSSEEIAQKLFISKHTVDNHRRNLLEKTNCKTSVGLVRFALENGFLKY
ncbi:helix-turn-helix transcriptional regulator [Chryseolinea sp. T2]|uniref:response regulator transcription factor n=1 Tax=Chryseolinea sp. T2 TaxID=3129255 RepID=UPI0030777C09